MKKLLLCMTVVLTLVACSADKRFFKQARLATSKGNFKEAIEFYTRAIKVNDKNFAAYLNRGVVWERMPAKDVKELQQHRHNAETDYLHALSLNPRSAEANNNLGALYLDMGRPLDATYYLSEAVNLQPNYFTALLNNGLAHQQLGSVSKALTYLNRAFALRQKDPLVLLNRGLLFFEMKNYQGAVSDFSRLLAAQPTHARAYLERARALTKLGYPADAYEDLERAVSLKPDYALAYYYMSDLMFRKGEKDMALGLLSKSKELSNTYAPAYELMGDMLSMEDPVAATANYKVALKLDPANAKRYNRKLQFMLSEKGRERILASRFYPRKSYGQ